MEEDRFENVRKANVAGVLGNVFLLIIKFIVGFLSKSQAMISDAVNSAGDIFASVMSSMGERIARVPEDDSHNFGHGKAEYIFSLFISISMIGVSIKLIYDSIVSLINPHEIEYQNLLIIVCLTTILVKLFLFIYTKFLGKKTDSILIEALKEDHRNDIAVTSCTLISVLLGMVGIHWFDGVVGVGIALVIAISGVKIFIESYDILMDKSIDDETKQVILDVIEKHKDIQKINHFTSTPVGYKYLISISIFVDGNMTTFQSHEIADNLEKDLNKLDKIYLAIIHVNPI